MMRLQGISIPSAREIINDLAGIDMLKAREVGALLTLKLYDDL